ncbi:MAG: DUF2058 family protein [Proteobacteria bacterium]|nr:DUF2058 family protein [Pseudomonadota bacterium]
MADSLRDQLLKAGLARATPPKKTRSKHPLVKKNPSQSSDLERAWQARAKEEKECAKKEKDRAKKRIELKQAEQKRRREINNKIVILLDSTRLNKNDAEISRNFFHFGKIRKVMVDQAQLAQLNSGTIAVVYLRGRYHLVSKAVAEQVQKLSPEHVPDLKGSDEPDESEHPVPDDLIW